ncbi:MAG: DUF1735 domain-containing protein [Ginsengibacter sp.]
MKYIIYFQKKYKILLFIGLLILFSSCLKDTREDLSKSPPLVGFLFPNPGFYPAQGGYLQSAPLGISSTPQTLVYDSTQAYPSGNNAPLEIELSYTSFPAPYPNAVTVTLGIDTSAIGKINDTAGTDFIMLPAGSYTLPNNGQVTIEPAQPGKYPIAIVLPQVTTSMLDASKDYVLPLKITSAPAGITIASNLNEAAMQVIFK